MQAEVMEAAAEPAATQESALTLRRFVAYQADGEVDEDDFIVDDSGAEAVASLCAGVILASGDERRVATLLAAGANCVFVGEAALLDSTVIDRLVAAHGAERIGIYAPLRRQSVSWSFETVSNADFKTVAPSHCEPAWEVLRADGTGTGTLAAWWLKAMRELGASHFLAQVDIHDDTDLNLCAGLIEDLGSALWLGPLLDTAPRLADWVAYGQCRQIVLPPATYARRTELLAAPAES
ncbi:MAG: hypothetical protein Q8M11_05180 [Sulfuritalea sp.]|nr:hypothetical protein [Sulfuritalea sp.]MDP1983873.1 hypothetical protein [Sulfuritalea sp.]